MAVSTTIHTSSHPWTKAQDEKLRQMVRDGWSVGRIAQSLSRTSDAVSQRIAEIGARPARLAS